MSKHRNPNKLIATSMAMAVLGGVALGALNGGRDSVPGNGPDKLSPTATLPQPPVSERDWVIGAQYKTEGGIKIVKADTDGGLSLVSPENDPRAKAGVDVIENGGQVYTPGG